MFSVRSECSEARPSATHNNISSVGVDHVRTGEKSVLIRISGTCKLQVRVIDVNEEGLRQVAVCHFKAQAASIPGVHSCPAK